MSEEAVACQAAVRRRLSRSNGKPIWLLVLWMQAVVRAVDV